MHVHKPSKGWVVKVAVIVTLGLVATELVVGHLAHSLALVSDGWSHADLLLAGPLPGAEAARPPQDLWLPARRSAGGVCQWANSGWCFSIHLF